VDELILTLEGLQAQAKAAGAALIGSILAVVIEGGRFAADVFRSTKDTIAELTGRIEKLEESTSTATAVGTAASDTAGNTSLGTSSAVGIFASSYVVVNGVDTTGAGAGATASLRNVDGGDSQLARFHRIRLAPAGTPGAGTQVTVTFPVPYPKTPIVQLTQESKSANQHQIEVTGVSKTGYTISSIAALTASSLYDMQVVVVPQP